MDDLYLNNLQALSKVNPFLADELQKIETNTKFEAFQENDSTDINILDLERERWVHHASSDDPVIKETEMKQFREYLFLYFFGIGNGLLFQTLLENKIHKQIVVIEPNLELIYIALHLIDVSEAIQTGRFVILRSDQLTFAKAIEMFHNSNAKFYFRVFTLHTASHYYLTEHFDMYKEIHDLCLKVMSHIAKAFGNDIADSLLGLRHHIKNLPLMIQHPTFSELCESKNSDLAVIVSTGPSLYKQLDKLKEAAPYITIISVDASLPILAAHNIKPDIVVSMERDEPTSKFFKNTPDEFHKDIVYLCASLQHESVFQAIHGGTLMLAMRPYPYNSYFQLDDFGYVCAGMSAANMAHELAFYMGFKTCAFIGQDLAYGDDGSSHSKGHVFGEEQIKDGIDTADNNAHYETIELPAYGEKGVVKSMLYWQIFLRFIEQAIEQTEHEMTSINATEGGVHIAGSIEKSFHDVIAKYQIPVPKKQISLTTPDDMEIADYSSLITTKINTILTEGKALQKKIEEAFLKIAEPCTKLENLNKDEMLKVFDIGQTMLLLDTISFIRKTIEESQIYQDFFINITQTVLYQQEMQLAEIKVMFVDNPTSNQEKALQWILGHRFWLFSLGGTIDHTLQIVEEESKSYL